MQDNRYTQKVTSGWLANSVNTWLAAIGTTVLVPGMRVGWTEEALPEAILEYPYGDPVQAVVDAWPSSKRIQEMPLSDLRLYKRKDTGKLKRKVLVEVFSEHLISNRCHPDAWTLTSTMTDLAVGDDNTAGNGSFDPAGPGTIKWLHHRLQKTYDSVTNPDHQIRASLTGLPQYMAGNGLGFDIARLGHSEDNWIDPVAEVLTFFGLAMFPVRGDGIKRKYSSARQRGWQGTRQRNFVWPAWKQPLDRYAIDALLDVWWYHNRDGNKPVNWQQNSLWKQLGIKAVWQSPRYTPTGSADRTCAYGATTCN